MSIRYRFFSFFIRYFSIKGLELDLNRVHALVKLDFRVLMRERFFRVVLGVMLIIPVAFLIVDQRTHSCKMIDMIDSFSDAIWVHYFLIIVASIGFGFWMRFKQSGTQYLMDSLCAGFHVKDIAAAICFEILAYATLLSISGVPILVLRLVLSNDLIFKTILFILAETTSSLLIVCFILFNNKYSYNIFDRRIIVGFLLFIVTIFLATVFVQTFGYYMLLSTLKFFFLSTPVGVIFTLFKIDYASWASFLFIFCPITWLMIRFIIVSVIPPSESELEEPVHQFVVIENDFIKTKVERLSKDIPLDFNRGNPINNLDNAIGIRLQIINAGYLFFSMSLTFLTTRRSLWSGLLFLTLLAIHLVMLVITLISGVLSFHVDRDSGRLGSYFMTRLSPATIITGKFRPILGSLRLPLLLGVACLATMTIFKMVSLWSAVFLAMEMLIYPVAMLVFSSVIGMRQKKLGEAIFMALLIPVSSILIGALGPCLGFSWMSVFSPITAYLNSNGKFFIECLALYGISALLAFIIAVKRFNHFILH